MTAEQLRRVDGGVIGNFSTKECVVDLAKDAYLAAVGSNLLGVKIPKGHFVVGAFIQNIADDLASSGAATLGVTVGSTAVLAATGKADIKGAGKCTIATAPVCMAADSDIKLVVGTAACTAGKLKIGVIYA